MTLYDVISDWRTFVTRVSTCLFALSKSTLRRLGKSDYRARPAVLFATLERNQKRSRRACPRSTFDYPCYRSFGCSRTPGSCDDEMSVDARDIQHGSTANATRLNTSWLEISYYIFRKLLLSKIHTWIK